MIHNKKINLLVITSMFPKDPEDITGIFVADYIRAVRAYCRITVLVLHMSGEKKGLMIEESNGVTFYRFNISKRHPRGLLKYLMYVLWFYKGWKLGRRIHEIDFIHAHNSTLCGNLGLLISHSRKVPIIITEHTNPFSKILRNPISRILTRGAIQKANAVLTVSEDLKKQIEQSGIRPKKTYVTYNPVDVEMFQPKEKALFGTDNKILFAGRLEEYKGGMRVIQAFHRLMNDSPGWSLTLVGDGPEMDSIKRLLAEKKELSAKVSLARQLRKVKLAEEMKQAAFFVYPSRHETFGIVVAEAMAAGLPVIVGKGTAMDEFVDESCGILVNPDDVSAIADAMRHMIANYPKYDSKKIRDKIAERFGFEAFGKRLIEIYMELI